MAILLTVSLAMVLRAGSAPAASAAPVVTPQVATRSVFILPSNSKEGRDPFFPSSVRPYESAVIPAAHSSDLSALSIRGFSADSHGNRLVIINKHTFGVGDEGDVVTSQGRIHLRCLGIKGNTVSIEVDGQRHELSYSDNP